MKESNFVPGSEDLPVDSADLNESVRKQFSSRADLYKTSSVHAVGEDLPWMLSEAAMTGRERVLDVGTGAGHTAFTFADSAWTVIGLDLTVRMVENATELAWERELANVQFVVGDSIRLPFPDAYFDTVTCRYAAHHFAKPGAAIQEIARVLKPTGVFLLADHVAPSNPSLDKFINRLDWLRDPSHIREWTVAEWSECFLAAGLGMTVPRRWDLHMGVDSWIERAAPSSERVSEIHQMLKNANADEQKVFSLQYTADGRPESFALKCALMKGKKET